MDDLIAACFGIFILFSIAHVMWEIFVDELTTHNDSQIVCVKGKQ